jgi:class 3 adenylate cyclase/tetratricopeptide (TPR) repeat protein
MPRGPIVSDGIVETERRQGWPRPSRVTAAVETERKVVTVVFADVAASTELAGRLDPERFREVMSAFFDASSELIESLRGRVEKFIGDAVMAVFGLPHTHEDDAVRAVRAGLAIRDRTARLGEELGVGPLAVRVGVASGPVAASAEPGPTDQFFVSGATVTLAARLQQAADRGEVLVSETTQQLARDAVGFGRMRSISVKGLGDLTAWPVSSLLARSSRRTIPLVGRRRELTLLRDAFERAREAPSSHLVTVFGQAGIGKTRLADELIAGLPEDTTVLVGRASEYDEDPTFGAVAEMVRRRLNVDRDATRGELRERLQEVVEGCCDPSETDRVVARLGLALGLGAEDEQSAEGKRYRAAEIRAGVQTFVEGLARSGPVVMVFDDLQLARPPLLELIEDVARRTRRSPVLILCLAREGLLEDRPSWGGGIADSITIRLDPLSLREATTLAGSAGGDLDDQSAERIAEHAGGNPFFIIETTGMLQLHEHVDDVVTALHSHLMPPTVQAVVASRIDHLSAEARELVRTASIFPGGRFEPWELELVTTPKDELLQELEDGELLVRDDGTDQAWRFRHDLLRDVAYESLAKRERLRLHLLAAEGLEAQSADRHVGAIAFHLEQAARASLDLEPTDRSVAERAVPALSRAGNLARWRMESRAAIDLYDRALALAGPEDAWGVREGRIQSAIGESRYWLGEYEEAESVLRRALEAAPDDPRTRTHALRFLADITLNVHTDPDAAARLFEQALGAAREHGEPWAMARTLLMAGWAPYWRDDLDGARAMFEEALRLARAGPRRDRWSETRALTSLISVTSPVGDEVDCLRLADEALAVAREEGDPFSIAVAQTYRGNSLRRMLDLEQARPAIEQALQTYRDLGARWEVASTLADAALVARLQGRFDEAQQLLEEGLEICRSLGERNLTAWNVGDLVELLVLRGRVDAATEVFRRHLAELEREPPPGITTARARMLIAFARGRRQEALDHARWIVERRRERGARNSIAAEVWWTGRVFGAASVGGEEALEDAGRTLEAAHWRHSLEEPDRFLAAVRR